MGLQSLAGCDMEMADKVRALLSKAVGIPANDADQEQCLGPIKNFKAFVNKLDVDDPQIQAIFGHLVEAVLFNVQTSSMRSTSQPSNHRPRRASTFFHPSNDFEMLVDDPRVFNGEYIIHRRSERSPISFTSLSGELLGQVEPARTPSIPNTPVEEATNIPSNTNITVRPTVIRERHGRSDGIQSSRADWSIDQMLAEEEERDMERYRELRGRRREGDPVAAPSLTSRNELPVYEYDESLGRWVSSRIEDAPPRGEASTSGEVANNQPGTNNDLEHPTVDVANHQPPNHQPRVRYYVHLEDGPVYPDNIIEAARSSETQPQPSHPGPSRPTLPGFSSIPFSLPPPGFAPPHTSFYPGGILRRRHPSDGPRFLSWTDRPSSLHRSHSIRRRRTSHNLSGELRAMAENSTSQTPDWDFEAFTTNRRDRVRRQRDDDGDDLTLEAQALQYRRQNRQNLERSTVATSGASSRQPSERSETVPTPSGPMSAPISISETNIPPPPSSRVVRHLPHRSSSQPSMTSAERAAMLAPHSVPGSPAAYSETMDVGGERAARGEPTNQFLS